MPSLLPGFMGWTLSQGPWGVRRVSSKGGTKSGLAFVKVPWLPHCECTRAGRRAGSPRAARVRNCHRPLEHGRTIKTEDRAGEDSLEAEWMGHPAERLDGRETLKGEAQGPRLKRGGSEMVQGGNAVLGRDKWMVRYQRISRERCPGHVGPVEVVRSVERRQPRTGIRKGPPPQTSPGAGGKSG